MSNTKSDWKNLSDSHATVDIDYFLHFPKAFSQLEISLTDEEYGFYWRLFHRSIETGGYLLYDIETIMHLTMRKSRKTTQRLLDKILELGEFELVEFEEVPEKFLKIFGKNLEFLKKNKKFLKNNRVAELVFHAQQVHDLAVSNGQKGGNASKTKRASKAEPASSDLDLDLDLDLEKNHTAYVNTCEVAEFGEPITSKEQLPKEQLPSTNYQVPIVVSACADELDEATTNGEAITNDQLPVTNCGVLQTALDENLSAVSSTDNRQPTTDSPASKYTFEDFKALWNKFAKYYGLSECIKTTPTRKKQFAARQKTFKEEGSYGGLFWEDVLAALSVYKDGWFIGKRNGVYDENAWCANIDYLLKNDQNIARLVEA